MAAILQSRSGHARMVLPAVLVLFLAFAACSAQVGSSAHSCPIEIQSLKDAAHFSSLPKDEQARVLHVFSDDIAEMAELDVARSLSSRSAYRNYFISRLQFMAVPGTTSTEKLLLIRYYSNTMCGSDENCPVWIVRLTHAGDKIDARSMVPWQEELGTSAGGGWGVGVLPNACSEYPDLIVLTHLSSTQTGLACYRESKRNYRRVDCSPDCTRLLEHSNDQDDGK